MEAWNPWKGCRKCSEGCKYCTSERVVKKKGVEEFVFEKSKQIPAPLEKNKNGEYRIPSGELVVVGAISDFFLNEADQWRDECWKVIKKRPDLMFVILTRRIERFYDCIPADWQLGYDNVIVACCVENQKIADEKIPIFLELPIKHKAISCQPLLELINLEPYLDNIDTVIAGGEAAKNARPLDFEWLPDIRWQCINTQTDFIFGKSGTHFMKDGKTYNITAREQEVHAKKININYYVEKDEHFFVVP